MIVHISVTLKEGTCTFTTLRIKLNTLFQRLMADKTQHNCNYQKLQIYNKLMFNIIIG